MLPAAGTTMARAMPLLPESESSGQARLRLWQLLSPTLPVGAFSFSGGLEAAVAAGWLPDREAVAHWIRGQLLHGQARVDIPMLKRLHQSWRANDQAAVERHAAFLRANRESAELAAEDRHVGQALARLLRDLEISDAERWVGHERSAWAVLFALALVRWDIPLDEGAEAYLWSWCDNQVAAAIKLVPLGQTDGQRLLLSLGQAIQSAAAEGLSLPERAVGGGMPGLAIASCWHEIQYSRLFRS